MRTLEPLRSAGAGERHLDRALRVWLAGGSLAREAHRARLPFPAPVRAALEEVEERLEHLARIVARTPGCDGGEGLLVELADGRRVESVLLPRGGLCISTQAGCAVGCTFCSTGRLGLARNLSGEEILAQVAVARRVRAVRRVVLMGMGEPAHSPGAVLEALEILGSAGDVGHKNLVVSTVGEPGFFERLAASRVRPALALSLHSTFPERRAALVPRAPRVEPRALVEAALAYAERVRYPLQLQWTLLAGTNDGDDELERLIEWLRGARVVVNYIPWNPGPGLEHARTSFERTRELTGALHRAGILAKLRRSAGRDVGVGCGQLRAGGLPRERTSRAGRPTG